MSIKKGSPILKTLVDKRERAGSFRPEILTMQNQMNDLKVNQKLGRKMAVPRVLNIEGSMGKVD